LPHKLHQEPNALFGINRFNGRNIFCEGSTHNLELIARRKLIWRQDSALSVTARHEASDKIWRQGLRLAIEATNRATPTVELILRHGAVSKAKDTNI